MTLHKVCMLTEITDIYQKACSETFTLSILRQTIEKHHQEILQFQSQFWTFSNELFRRPLKTQVFFLLFQQIVIIINNGLKNRIITTKGCNILHLGHHKIPKTQFRHSKHQTHLWYSEASTRTSMKGPTTNCVHKHICHCNFF